MNRIFAKLAVSAFFMSLLCVVPSTSFAFLIFGKFETGALLPVGIYNLIEDTSIGLTIQDPQPGKKIFWTFFGADGSRYSYGSMDIESDRQDYSLSLWAMNEGVTGFDLVGYVVFTLDDDGILEPGESNPNLAAQAFLVNPGYQDAAMLPVVPLTRGDYAAGAVDLNNLNSDSLVGLTYGQAAAKHFSCRYFVDPAFGATTRIVLLSLQDAPERFSGEIRSMTNPEVVDVELISREKRLNVLSVLDNMEGRPADYLEGSVVVDNPGVVAVCFVIVRSTTLNALQTLPAFDME